jgi:hypothetical protein
MQHGPRRARTRPHEPQIITSIYYILSFVTTTNLVKVRGQHGDGVGWLLP